MKTENISAKSLDAPVPDAQATQPATATHHAVAGYHILRSHFLIWFGILGGVLTVFGNIGKVVTLSNWAHWIVDHWHEWMHAFWTWILSMFGIHISAAFVPPLSFFVFTIILGIGVWVKDILLDHNDDYRHHVEHPFRTFLVGLVIWLFSAGAITVAVRYGIFNFLDYEYENPLMVVVSSSFLFGCICFASFVYVLAVSQERLRTLGCIILFVLFCVAIIWVPLIFLHNNPEFTNANDAMTTALLFAPIVLLGAIVFVPIRPLIRRLTFMAIGLVIVIVLNEISRHDLNFLLQPPK